MKNKKNTKKKKDSSFYTKLKKLGVDFEFVENPPDFVSKNLKQNGFDEDDVVVGRFFSINNQLTDEEISIRISTLLECERQLKLIRGLSQ